MAPTVVSRSGGSSPTNETAHPITLPTGISIGELLLVFIAFDNITTPSTTSNNWVRLGFANAGGEGSLGAFVKKATGSDALSIASAGSEQSAHNSMRISNWSGDISKVFSTFASSVSNSLPDPPVLSPSPGVDDYLWLVGAGTQAADQTTEPPTGFSNYLPRTSGSSISNAALATAEIKLTTGTLNPGAFSGAEDEWNTVTIAIAPFETIMAPDSGASQFASFFG